MKKTVIIIVLAVIVLGGGLVYILTQTNSKDSGVTSNQTGTSPQSTNQATTADTKSSLTITFTNDGFDKSSYSVKAGSVVTVKNESNKSVQFSSGVHPTHLEDPEINMEELAPGESGTFTPTKKGSHDFHDHLHSQYGGMLVVE